MTNIDKRIKQCESDIKVLEGQKQQLLKEKEKKYVFKPGDIVKNTLGEARLIVSVHDHLYAVSLRGGNPGSENGTNFAGYDYEKIGRCAGFNIVSE